MTIIDIVEATQSLPDLVERAEAGEEILIARAGHPMVQLLVRTTESSDLKPRKGNRLAGQIWISPDFDAPLDDEVATAFGMIDS